MKERAGGCHLGVKEKKEKGKNTLEEDGAGKAAEGENFAT